MSTHSINSVKTHLNYYFFDAQKHARRVYEILRLRATDMSDEEKAREYRLEVKKRLFGPYRVRLSSSQLQSSGAFCQHTVTL